jgi:hypothetical protein
MTAKLFSAKRIDVMRRARWGDVAPRERFLSHVDQSAGLFECWPWTGARTPLGYGWVKVPDAGPTPAHRRAYQLLVGPIPAGLHVLHSCDNPPCVNPAHLRLGTHAENMRDAVERNRFNPLRGSANPLAVLTESEVRQIRRRYRAGEPARAIATDLGGNLWTVREAAYGRRHWQHVADLEPEALQATSQIVSLSERRLRQTDPDGGQAA